MSEEFTNLPWPAVVTLCSVADPGARQRAAVNVAVLLAQAGYRVGLCAIDSAPHNLHDYLATDPEEREVLGRLPGLWDLVTEYQQTLASAARADISEGPAERPTDIGATDFGSLRLRRPSTYLTSLATEMGLQGAFFLLPAGGNAAAGNSSVTRPDWTRFDWTGFIANYAGAAYLRLLRDDLLASLDFLVTSSESSFDESTRATTIRFADIVVLMTDYGRANMDQTLFLGRLLTGPVPTGWAEGPPPVILPVAGEIDAASERALLESGRSRFAEMFAPFPPSQIQARDFFYEAEIPAVPYYRHSAQLVALARPEQRDRGLYGAYRYLSRTIAASAPLGRFVPAGDAIDPVRAFAGAKARVRWDAFISYSSRDSAYARRLRDELSSLGLRTFVAEEDIALEIGTDQWKAALDRVLERSETLLLVVTTTAMQARWVEYEWSEFLKKERLIIPICLEGPGPRQLPEELQRFHTIDCRPSGIEKVHLNTLNTMISGAVRHTGEPA